MKIHHTVLPNNVPFDRRSALKLAQNFRRFSGKLQIRTVHTWAVGNARNARNERATVPHNRNALVLGTPTFAMFGCRVLGPAVLPLLLLMASTTFGGSRRLHAKCLFLRSASLFETGTLEAWY